MIQINVLYLNLNMFHGKELMNFKSYNLFTHLTKCEKVTLPKQSAYNCDWLYFASLNKTNGYRGLRKKSQTSKIYILKTNSSLQCLSSYLSNQSQVCRLQHCAAGQQLGEFCLIPIISDALIWDSKKNLHIYVNAFSDSNQTSE